MATIINMIALTQWETLFLLADYALFLFLSFLQYNLVKDIENSPGASVYGYNFVALLKNVFIFGLFILPHYFMSIHTQSALSAVSTILMFCCIVFIMVNYIAEQVYVRKLLKTCPQSYILGEDNLPKPLSVSVNYFSLVFAGIVFVTTAFHILATGYIGEIWFLIAIAIYCIFSDITKVYGLRKNNLKNSVCYIIFAGTKLTVPLILFSYFIEYNFGEISTSAAYDKFGMPYAISSCICMACLCIVAILEISVVMFSVYGLIKRRIAKNAK